MGAIKYPVNACGMRDSLSGDMLVSSQRNQVLLVLALPQPKIASYAPGSDCHESGTFVTYFKYQKYLYLFYIGLCKGHYIFWELQNKVQCDFTIHLK